MKPEVLVGGSVLWVWSAWQLWNAATSRRIWGRLYAADLQTAPIWFWIQVVVYVVWVLGFGIAAMATLVGAHHP